MFFSVIIACFQVYLQASLGWRYAFLLPSAIVATFSILVFFFFQLPAELGLHIPGKGRFEVKYEIQVDFIIIDFQHSNDNHCDMCHRSAPIKYKLLKIYILIVF